MNKIKTANDELLNTASSQASHTDTQTEKQITLTNDSVRNTSLPSHSPPQETKKIPTNPKLSIRC